MRVLKRKLKEECNVSNSAAADLDSHILHANVVPLHWFTIFTGLVT